MEKRIKLGEIEDLEANETFEVYSCSNLESIDCPRAIQGQVFMNKGEQIYIGCKGKEECNYKRYHRINNHEELIKFQNKTVKLRDITEKVTRLHIELTSKKYSGQITQEEMELGQHYIELLEDYILTKIKGGIK